MEKLLFTRGEVAKLLGVSVATVELLKRSGQLPVVRVGRNTRIAADALTAFAKVGTDNRTADGKPLSPIWVGKSAA